MNQKRAKKIRKLLKAAGSTFAPLGYTENEQNMKVISIPHVKDNDKNKAELVKLAPGTLTANTGTFRHAYQKLKSAFKS